MTTEKKVGHTPAPWRLEEDHGVFRIIGPRAKCTWTDNKPGWELARIDNQSFWDMAHHRREDRANARLLAAAPDLLAACLAVRKAKRVSRNPVKTHADAAEAMDAAVAQVLGALERLGVTS